MKLHYQVIGSGQPIVILHGLFGSLSNWNSIGKVLAQHYKVITVDLRNHGRSDWNNDVSYLAMATDVAELIVDLQLEPPHIIGHSMGGKTAMVLSLHSPHLLRSMTVVDIAPVSYSHSHTELIDTLLSVDLANINNRKDIDTSLLPNIADAGMRMFIAQNVVRESSGYRWRVNLSALRAGMNELIGFPEDISATFSKPSLFLWGQHSDYIKNEYYQKIYSLFPNAEINMINDAGHWLHAENPSEMTTQTLRFLKNII